MNYNLFRVGSLLARWSAQCVQCTVICSAKRPVRRCIFTTPARQLFGARDKDHGEKQKQLIIYQGDYFNKAGEKERSKRTFQLAVHMYLKQNSVYRRGHVEFLYAALDRLNEYDVNHDLDVYKQLFSLFPEGKMVPRGPWEVEFMHYPKQQQCAIDMMDIMEHNGVCPDDDMGYQLIRIFGRHGHAFRKYQRMMYWMPKFKFASPYYVPHNLPSDSIELAKIALKRMAVDLENKVTVYRTEDLEAASDETYVVSAQSPVQSQLIANHAVDKPVFVEGGFTVWLRDKSLTYFVLQADCTDKYTKYKEEQTKPKDESEMFNWRFFEEERPKALEVPPSAHEQDDGTVLAMCITGTASKDSLASWIRFLEQSNQKLSQIPVVFRLKTPPHGEVDVWAEKPEPRDLAQ